MSGGVESPFFPVRVVTFQTVLVENGLNVAGERENIGIACDGFRVDRRASHEAEEPIPVVRVGRFRSLFVTADARRALSRHDGRKRVHSFNAMTVFVHREEEERSVGRQVEVGGSFRRNGRGAVKTLQGKRPERRHLLHAAGIMNRLGQRLVNQQMCNSSRRDVFHFASAINIRQSQRTPLGVRVGLV